MSIQIVKNKITKAELAALAQNQFGDLVKAVVDVEKEIMAIGGDLHADEEALLLEQGSVQKNLWGINLYLKHSDENFIEFDSMINVRPSQGNMSRGVEDAPTRDAIWRIVKTLVPE